MWSKRYTWIGLRCLEHEKKTNTTFGGFSPSVSQSHSHAFPRDPPVTWPGRPTRKVRGDTPPPSRNIFRLGVFGRVTCSCGGLLHCEEKELEPSNSIVPRICWSLLQSAFVRPGFPKAEFGVQKVQEDTPRLPESCLFFCFFFFFLQKGTLPSKQLTR